MWLSKVRLFKIKNLALRFVLMNKKKVGYDNEIFIYQINEFFNWLLLG